jgi:hypothetical protein
MKRRADFAHMPMSPREEPAIAHVAVDEPMSPREEPTIHLTHVAVDERPPRGT